MKVVFDNLANFLSISPNQTPVFAVCLPGPRWTFLPFLSLLILYSLPYMYTLGQSIEEKERSYGKDKSSIIWPKCPLDVLARVKSY